MKENSFPVKLSDFKNQFTFFACVGILILVILGCNLPKENNTNSATTPVAQKTPTPTASPTPTPVAYPSGGLGLDKLTWENSNGTGKPDNANSPMFFAYQGGTIQVQFSYPRPGNIKYIERIWGDRNAVSISEARKESKLYIPKDAKFVRTFTSSSGSTVDLYKSESLKSRFSEDEFIGGKGGDFIVLYRNQTGKTTTFIIALGNNP